MTGSSTTGRKYHRPSAGDRAWIAFVRTFSGGGFDRQLRQADQTVVVDSGERPVLSMATRIPQNVIMGFRKGGVEI